VIVYAVVDSRDEPGSCAFGDAIDVYIDRRRAITELEGILSDEPTWRAFLSLVDIELDSGSPN